MKNIFNLTAIALVGLTSSASAVVQCTEFTNTATKACWAKKALLEQQILKPVTSYQLQAEKLTVSAPQKKAVTAEKVATTSVQPQKTSVAVAAPVYLNGSTGCVSRNAVGSYNFGDDSTQFINSELSYESWTDGRTQDDALFIYFGESATDSIALSGSINGVTGMIDFSIENEVAGGGATSISLGSLAIGDSLNKTALTFDTGLTQNASGSFDLTYSITDSSGAVVLGGTESNLSNATLATSDSIRLGHSYATGSDTFSDGTSTEAGASFLGGTRLADGSYSAGGKICSDCVPEPSSALLLALAGIGAITRRRR